jgi:hypothetical protein
MYLNYLLKEGLGRNRGEILRRPKKGKGLLISGNQGHSYIFIDLPWLDHRPMVMKLVSLDESGKFCSDSWFLPMLSDSFTGKWVGMKREG